MLMLTELVQSNKAFFTPQIIKQEICGRLHTPTGYYLQCHMIAPAQGPQNLPDIRES